MKRTINLKKYILLVLVICVLTLTIAYAILSTTLNISGSATVQKSSWNVSLGQGVSIFGHDYEISGTAVYNSPTFNGMTATYQISLSKPGDSVEYFFRILNTGTINAEIDSIINSTPTCTSSTNNTEDASLVCNNLIYEVSYNDGKVISVGDVLNTSENVPQTCLKGSTIGTVRSIKVKITFKESATAVPSSTVTVSNLKTTINVVQTDKECISDGSTPEPT